MSKDNNLLEEIIGKKILLGYQGTRGLLDMTTCILEAVQNDFIKASIDLVQTSDGENVEKTFAYFPIRVVESIIDIDNETVYNNIMQTIKDAQAQQLRAQQEKAEYEQQMREMMSEQVMQEGQ